MKDKKTYQILRILNNNTLLAKDELGNEVVLLGKGIGFNCKKREYLVGKQLQAIEKVFTLSSDANRDSILRVLTEADDETIHAIHDVIQYIEKNSDLHFTEQFLVSFIDHISFAIKRLQQGINIDNPFLFEIRTLYPEEFALALQGLKILEQKLNLEIPEDEAGFITLHLHSLRTNQSINKMNRFSALVNQLIHVIEEELAIKIDKESIDYARLVTHLRFAIERTEQNQHLGENHPLSSLLQKEYPICYNLAWKLVKIMQNTLKTEIPKAEVVYLTMHIQRILNHINEN
ncbi:glucose PTS transporter transcription antiterminator GlcT [Tepidibacillus fermentans]|uniref:BglG family transcriptional antiterminator n=1 Tax=Tepidibacillus fermentans TaxID=1281767 RepID=A0A4R3KF39_9BACI|nr:PRD domain-containing protein [Tepidibacillus fermentans]TCS81790.1 BglG family transcriptional antiterminator [Tepidibacillus fermentans]